ncbi:hypothetical protein DYB36_008895 [Aphanomyces astaci]|uniref:non-specific serine/threonine protein kinase n=1 Tax=Aphanomyces astaci TaxID=112090 RepID=A0A397BC25_APHAT|nr:hypothetical protein DYB36_008895 [Aphanomyces astaci]
MDETEAFLFKSLTCIRARELDDAKRAIEDCRAVLDPTIQTFISESYARAYMPCLVQLQNLAELEEVISHLDGGGDFARLQQIWTTRLLGVDRDIKVWQHLMLVRSLVLNPKDDVHVWLKYARLCRQNGQLHLAFNALANVGADVLALQLAAHPNVPLLTNLEQHNPRVAFAFLKHLWADNKEEIALKQLQSFIHVLEQDHTNDYVSLRVQAYTQLGKWQMTMMEPKLHHEMQRYDQVLECLKTATVLDPTNYKAWHEWALMNFRAAEASKDDSYVTNALDGFFNSITFGHSRYDVTKDVLRLLTLWFNYGGRLVEVHDAVSDGLAKVSIDTWLEFIPQLIARLHSSQTNHLLNHLLTRIGHHHPQALIYPITVASTAVGAKRKVAAEGILAAVKRHSPQLVQEAELVSRELIRVAILWNELWHGALEEASRLYFAVHDVQAMLNELAPLHAQLDNLGVGDDRVMQLFGLINTLLANDSDTRKRNLAIERFSVLPLSHTSGLIGWVENTDTLHQLIRDYRESRKIPLNIEYRLMVQMAPDYEKLPIAQKLEAYENALNETTGQDLYKVLWLKSFNAEMWLDRRRNFTRSLAVMSMAGYILGLGDRHPGNLMLDRISGKMVHIDFGDCFDVAIEREKYPETVPFRLTRMLTQAMEVSGLEGTFRHTCEASMRVLRENRDSLMAILEAFVHDPLITWRLLAPHAAPSHAYAEEDKADKEDEVKGRRSSVDSLLVMDDLTFEEDEFDLNAAALKEDDDGGMQPEQLNAKAVKVIECVKKKLRGRDFDQDNKPLSVPAQVDRLIQQATAHENLCQLYYGWCPFW